MATANFNKQVFEVKPTGKNIHKKAKTYQDFNGYSVEIESSNRQQLGLYKGEELVYILGHDQQSIFKGTNKIGTVKLKSKT